MRLVRLSLLWMFAVAAWVVPGVAGADAPPLQPATDHIEIRTYVAKTDPKDPSFDVNDSDNWNDITGEPNLEPYFLNAGACTCETPIRIVLRKRASLTLFEGSGQIWVGTGCDTVDSTRPMNCTQIGTFEPSFFENNAEKVVILEAGDLMFAGTSADKCKETDPSIISLYALIDKEANNSAYESKSAKQYNVDTRPPPQVSELEAGGTEAGVTLTWKLPDERIEDIFAFQALCSKADGMKLLDEASHTAKFVEACTPLDGPTPTADAGVPSTADAGASDAAPAPFAATVAAAAGEPPIDKEFVCGEASGTANDLSIEKPEGWEFGVPFNIRLLVIDRSGNYFDMGTKSAAPIPSYDFWELYGDAGGDGQGGYCFVATAAYGDYDHPFVLVLRDFRDHTLAKFGAGRAFIAWYYRSSPAVADYIREHEVARFFTRVLLWPVVILAGTWEYTGPIDKLALFAVLAFVVVWRRRRKQALRAARSEMPSPAPRRRQRALAAGAATVLVLLCTSHIASAQAVYDDQFDDELNPPESDWAFEIKFGPYTPDIDSEFTTPMTIAGQTLPYGPYATMYGDKEGGSTDGLLTQMEVDRFFLHPYGQLGVAFGVGYMQKWAHSFAQKDNGDPDFTVRSGTDKSTFRLVPLFVGAVYRYTQLADYTVVPVVPYGKLGFTYDLWWSLKGDGKPSQTMQGGEGKGGVLGWQGSLGLSFRADAIDPGSARNMQLELGVEHVGFFAEVTYASVNGILQEHKPRLGDLTWSAGINFEF